MMIHTFVDILLTRSTLFPSRNLSPNERSILNDLPLCNSHNSVEIMEHPFGKVCRLLLLPSPDLCFLEIVITENMTPEVSKVEQTFYKIRKLVCSDNYYITDILKDLQA